MNAIEVARYFARKVKLDALRGVYPDIIGILEDREHRKLARLGKKHKLAIPELRWRRQIFRDNGRDLVFDSDFQWMHSVNRNYYNICFSWGNLIALSTPTTFGTGNLNLKDTGGTVRNDTNDIVELNSADPDSRDTTYGLLAQAADDTLGLIIGTDNTAESFEQFAIGTLTPNGSGTGPPIEFDYSQSELHSLSNSVLTLKDTRIRDFNNNSGSSENIEEVAEYWGLFMGGGVVTVMTIRDVTGSDVVGDADQYRVTLESTLVYPS
jgi:hypothetical protein